MSFPYRSSLVSQHISWKETFDVYIYMYIYICIYICIYIYISNRRFFLQYDLTHMNLQEHNVTSLQTSLSLSKDHCARWWYKLLRLPHCGTVGVMNFHPFSLWFGGRYPNFTSICQKIVDKHVLKRPSPPEHVTCVVGWLPCHKGFHSSWANQPGKGWFWGSNKPGFVGVDSQIVVVVVVVVVVVAVAVAVVWLVVWLVGWLIGCLFLKKTISFHFFWGWVKYD